MSTRASQAALRYARALFSLAQEEQVLDAVGADLRALASLLQDSPGFAALAGNPLLPPERVGAALDALFGKSAHSLTLRFFKLLVSKGRLGELAGVCAEFGRMHDVEAGRLRVQITAAQPLTDTQLDEMKRRLAKRHGGKEIITTVDTDPALLGGFQIRIGDTVSDYSLATQLKTYRQQVLSA